MQPQQPTNPVRDAWRLFNAGQIEESRARLRRLIAEGRRPAEAWYCLAEISRRTDDPSRAEREYLRALDEDGGHANALYRLGELAERRDQLRTATGFYVRALAAQADHASANRRLKALLSRQRSRPAPTPGPAGTRPPRAAPVPVTERGMSDIALPSDEELAEWARRATKKARMEWTDRHWREMPLPVALLTYGLLLFFLVVFFVGWFTFPSEPAQGFSP